jgi:hypothetical protein
MKEEVRNSPEMASHREAVETAEKEREESEYAFEAHRRKGKETWEQFIARSKTDPELVEARRTRDEKRRMQNEAGNRLEAAVNNYPQIQEAQNELDQADQLLDEVKTELSLIKDGLKQIESRCVDLYGDDFWRRGWRVAEVKWKEILERKQKEWAMRDSERYGHVLENQSFEDPLIIETNAGTIYAAIDAGVPKRGKEKPNEDRVFVFPATEAGTISRLMAIDGMGGEGDGNTAAEIFARVAQVGTVEQATVQEIQNNAGDEMLEVGIESGGICHA